MPDEAKELIENRITSEELQGFRSRAGKGFKAKLRLTDDWKVEFVFDGPAPGSRRGKPKDEEGAAAAGDAGAAAGSDAGSEDGSTKDAKPKKPAKKSPAKKPAKKTTAKA
jgi:hypothetical protein